jgi:threo-3-hydroxy-L-aspartate ammonia-lyase
MITLADIEAARRRIEGIAMHTPLLEDPSGSGLRLKAEHLQVTGSFKIRGAANAVSLAAEAGARHVVTDSSGNHGQAVAWVARHLGLKATVVLPENAVARKVEAVRSCGAAIVLSGMTTPERYARANEIAQREGAVYIPPFNHPHVMAGQGTLGLEILEQAGEVGTVYVPVGGGGLIAGTATALKAAGRPVRLVGAEPELAADTYLSFQRGELVAIDYPTGTLADGLRSTQPGALTFAVIRERVDEIMLVTEEEIRQAVRYLAVNVKQVVEPSGAVSLAAALRVPRGAVAVLSGGNADLGLIASLLR